MIKVSNKICSIVLSCLLVIGANIKVSHAFGFFPPMPFDIVLDVPANAGKVVSILQETKRYADSLKRYKKALSIQAVVGKIKLFALEQADKFGIDPTKLAQGGLGLGNEDATYEVSEVLQKNNQLGIDKKGETDEEKLENLIKAIDELKVKIKKNKIEISFVNSNDLNRLLEIMNLKIGK